MLNSTDLLVTEAIASRKGIQGKKVEG